jgi:asparagine synthase (glutamine-hydrolysing)
MCRIFGYFGVTRLDLGAAGRVADETRHGGPDETSIFARDDWCLGVNRLSVEDAAGGRQPYELDGKIFCVFNGEIYNHHTLRADLAAKGLHVAAVCDGAVLPYLYMAYGYAFVERLEGMFSFALVDLRAEPKLMLATDHLAIKPLYLAWEDGGVMFASELRGLRKLAGDRPLNIRRIDSYLHRQSVLGPQTIFEGVEQLRPSTFRIGSGERLGRTHVYHPETYACDPQHADSQALANTLEIETQRMAKSDAMVCSIVSGGLDSSLLTSLACRSGIPDHFKAFHVTCKSGWSQDERGYACSVCADLGIDLDILETDPNTYPDRIGDLVAHLGQPNSGAHALSMFLLYEEISRQGYKVVLAGEGADEMFGGYTRFADAAYNADPNWRESYCDRLAAIPAARRNALYEASYRQMVEDQPDPTLASFLALENVPQEDRLPALLQYDQDERFPYYILNRTDHTSAAFGVEVRVPFCQPSVTGLARALPRKWRATASNTKPALFAAAEGYLPQSILERPKQPFTLPVSEMFDTSPRFADFLCDHAAGIALRRSGCFDMSRLGALVDTARVGADPKERNYLWALAILDVWLEQRNNL